MECIAFLRFEAKKTQEKLLFRVISQSEVQNMTIILSSWALYLPTAIA
jgi:hypothetical protein